MFKKTKSKHAGHGHTIAYLTMEAALESDIKTYSGGLGVLAGDTLRSASDLGLPMVGITLLNDQGYFKQKIDSHGRQQEVPVHYNFKKLIKLNQIAKIKIGKDTVKIRAWKYTITGIRDQQVPVYLLDTDVPGNTPTYRALTGRLYQGKRTYRLMQEIVLGRGGVKMLQKLGYKVRKYHLNEGHAAMAPIELYEQSRTVGHTAKVAEVKSKCVFTTHTPVPAGHDRFDKPLFKELVPNFPIEKCGPVSKSSKGSNKEVNLTQLSLYFSSYVNGVAAKHGKVSSKMFPKYEIDWITNGVHAPTWTSPEFAGLYDKYVPDWRSEPASLRNTLRIPMKDIWQAHLAAKKRLADYVFKKQKTRLDQNVFTIGFARRFTGYKRANLLLHDLNRLLEIQKNSGKIQIIYGGKAHPSDDQGKELIEKIYQAKAKLKGQLEIIFLAGYEMDLAKILVPGVDLWLNTPIPPNEASGTSGMKAALNGVPHHSTLDGWWIEGHIEGTTGWSIGHEIHDHVIKEPDAEDAIDLYDKLEKKILPLYYRDRAGWQKVMQQTIALNGSFFNTHRMVQQYVQEAYY